MRAILQGSLRHFSASELLLLFASRQHTGTLDCRAGDAHLRLSFRDGKLIFAEGDANETVAKLVAWEDGEFDFLDEVSLPEGAKALSIDVGPLVAAAEEKIAEAKRALSLYPDDSIVFRVIEKPKSAISLGPDEFQILFQVAAGRSLAELKSQTGRPEVELYPIVNKLQTNGLIELATAETSTAKAKTAETKRPMIGTLTADSGTMHPLLEEITTIGRTNNSDVVISDGSVSSRHARVVRSAQGFVLEDLGSRNGSFVNSEKIEKRLLADGDIVRFGKIVLTFNIAVETSRKETTQPELLSGLPTEH
jgi:hypothetical protein